MKREKLFAKYNELTVGERLELNREAADVQSHWDTLESNEQDVWIEKRRVKGKRYCDDPLSDSKILAYRESGGELK